MAQDPTEEPEDQRRPPDHHGDDHRHPKGWRVDPSPEDALERLILGTERRMVGLWGMSDVIGPLAVIPEEGQAPALLQGEISPETAKVVDDEVKRIVDEALDEVRSLLEEHRGQLDALAAALLENETLDTDAAYEAAGLAAFRELYGCERAVSPDAAPAARP